MVMEQAIGDRHGGLRAWMAFAVAGLVVTVALAGLATLFTPAETDQAVWFSAALAYALQLPSFAALIWFRSEAQLILAGWMIGMALRFGALGGVAWWLSRSAAFPREVALVSLVAFAFVLLLMEPIFLRWDMRRS